MNLVEFRSSQVKVIRNCCSALPERIYGVHCRVCFHWIAVSVCFLQIIRFSLFWFWFSPFCSGRFFRFDFDIENCDRHTYTKCTRETKRKIIYAKFRNFVTQIWTFIQWCSRVYFHLGYFEFVFILIFSVFFQFHFFCFFWRSIVFRSFFGFLLFDQLHDIFLFSLFSRQIFYLIFHFIFGCFCCNDFCFVPFYIFNLELMHTYISAYQQLKVRQKRKKLMRHFICFWLNK